LPLLTLDNPFQVREVWRPSIAEEMAVAGTQSQIEPEARVFVAVAAEAPPRPRLLREGLLCSVEPKSCADAYPGGSTSLAAYWVAHGWTAYSDETHAKQVRQALVRHGTTVLSYPADRVWRLGAPVRVSDDMPLFTVSPRCILVAEPGSVLLCVDYSQLEVRLMAHFSQDARFIDILHRDGDVFRHVAAGWLRKSEAEVTAEERSGAKRICYGLIYGMGAGRLAVELGISRLQAQEFQESFMREYSGIATWVQSCRERARHCGYVETLHGRRRFLPALAAKQRAERSHAERQAVNTLCQASAADLIKMAMLRIHDELTRLRVHEGGQCRMPGRMLLQLHDELLIEIEQSWLDKVKDIVISGMINAGKNLRVPLRVKWKTGRTWGTLE